MEILLLIVSCTPQKGENRSEIGCQILSSTKSWSHLEKIHGDMIRDMFSAG
jgi:hypothetical protein